jgi:putative nucleotidyltransferase with HDIG domain
MPLRTSRVSYGRAAVNSTLKVRLYLASQWLVLGATVLFAGLNARSDEWQPLQLVALLMAMTVASDRLTVRMGGQNLSASFVALVLVMTLLGPVPAAAFGAFVLIVDSPRNPRPFGVWLSNMASYVGFLVVGGVLTEVLVGDVHLARNQAVVRSVTFAVIVFGIFVLTNLLNFVLIAIQQRVLRNRSILDQVRSLLMPVLPGQLAAAPLAAILAVAYTNLGYPMLVGVVAVILIFQYLGVALARSEDRAQQVTAHARRLATLQLGVLTTLVETLALRDRTTARHAAAVAHYARRLAHEVGCDEATQDLVHTAGLLHDIGKFALPDRILNAEILSDDDWSVIRRHPQEGATLVGRLDGYGPVADAILYHHERVDGGGYPAGLIGSEIPLASRIVAVCSTFDTLTARGGYRAPMTHQDATGELRKVAGHQLDADLVESFVSMVEREGDTFDPDKADFEAELSFEQRARTLAQPTAGYKP